MSTAGRNDVNEARIFDYAFLGAYNVAIFKDVLGKVDLGWLDGRFGACLCD